MPFIGKTS